MTLIETLGLILGSNLALETVRYFKSRKRDKADTFKVKLESDGLILDNDIKISNYWKGEWKEMRDRYILLESSMKSLKDLYLKLYDSITKLKKVL